MSTSELEVMPESIEVQSACLVRIATVESGWVEPAGLNSIMIITQHTFKVAIFVGTTV